jgi:hypothetical protein
MQRAKVILALALIVLMAGSTIGSAADFCDEQCQGDGADGSCALEVCCSCCVHSRFDPPVSVRAAPRAAIAEALAPMPASTRPSPDPRDILHVPKPSLS